jgi:hypothetical protein
VGLRANDEELVELLRRALAPYRTAATTPYPNLSLYRGNEDGSIRELHRLYRQGLTKLRTPSLGRLVRTAVRYLDHFVSPPEGLIPLATELVVGSRGAVLVAGADIDLMPPARRLARSGWLRSAGVVPLLDPSSYEIVVEEHRFAMDPAVQAEVDERWPPEADETAVPPGRYPIRAVVLLGARPDHLRVASSARRLASFATLLDTTWQPARAADVEAVAGLDGRVEDVRALGFDPKELAEILRKLGD